MLSIQGVPGYVHPKNSHTTKQLLLLKDLYKHGSCNLLVWVEFIKIIMNKNCLKIMSGVTYFRLYLYLFIKIFENKFNNQTSRHVLIPQALTDRLLPTLRLKQPYKKYIIYIYKKYIIPMQ